MGETDSVAVRRARGYFYGQAGSSTETYSPALVEWMKDGLCRWVDPDIFFPAKGGGGYEAKRICRVCPVMSECREWAVARPGIDGVWGGLSERERQKVRMMGTGNGGNRS